MRNLTIGSVIEKNKIVSEETFVCLFELRFPKIDGETVYRVCRWVEDIVFQGENYIRSDFDFEVQQRVDELPTAKITGHDSTGNLAQILEEANGGVDGEVTILVVSTANLSEAEFSDKFVIRNSSISNGNATFTLATPNYLSRRFPPRFIMRDQCSWGFKSTQCGYIGEETKCDYTLDDCRENKQNAVNFGGFPSLSLDE